MESRSLRLLEFNRVLETLSTYAVSEAGAAACLDVRPLKDVEAVSSSVRELREAARWIGESQIRLSAFPSLDGLFANLDVKHEHLDHDDLFALRIVFGQAETVRESLKNFEDRGWDELGRVLFSAPWPQTAVSGINRCLDPDGRIRDESSPELSDVRREIRNIHQRCTRKVKDFVLREDLSNALQDDFITISSDRYVMPLKANFKGRVKGIIHDYSQTGETCYFEPMFLVEMNNRLQELKREEREEELKVLRYLTGLVRRERDGVLGVYKSLVALDVLMAKVAYGEALDGRAVDVREGAVPTLKGARHPLLATGGNVHPLNISFTETTRSLVISGGNAGGKTVCLKTLGLCALMALSGLPVPVEEGSVLPPWSNVFVVMGDEQSLDESVSTFTAQISYIRRVWDSVDENTLFILDEFGAGTDPTQGAALAQAVIDSLLEREAMSVVATHFPALKAYAMATEGVRAACVLFDPRTKQPLFELAYDQVGASIALDVAKENGLPEEILDRAERYLLMDGSDTTAVLDRLNELAVEREKEIREAESVRRKMQHKHDKLEADFEQRKGKLLKDIQGQAQDVVRQWKQDRISRKQAQKKLADARETLVSTGDKAEKAVEKAFSFDDLEPGMKVTYTAWNREGDVVEINKRKKQAKVDVGGVAMWVKAEHLQPAGGSSNGAKPSSAKGRTPKAKPADSLVTLRLDLRGRRADEALAELDRFLDEALLKGAGRLEIVHGRGTGALRREVHDFLKHYPAVSSFSLAPEDQGGDGMTEVLLT
ncbi:endonuclease MutS2 [Desulfovibrio oxyclinae]|uniref:endonuclease MutS2 n=1 Tax=Desulfovibrio oxyclinae TaxID=63560 RepID=UPI000366A372|nr:endonuclease MutS2 [Desulfovibrio oxyclinae]